MRLGDTVSADDRWLIVGLGNPGSEYDATRHNIGFAVVDELVQRCSVGLRRHRRAHAQTAEGHLGGHPVVLAKPSTYMNRSGDAVSGLAGFYRIAAERVMAVHDELDLPLGSLRIKSGGGSGGHNGVKSISASLGTPDFLRIRLGIGRPPGQMDPATYVLRRFASTERDEAAIAVQRGADAATAIIEQGLAKAQNIYNA